MSTIRDKLDHRLTDDAGNGRCLHQHDPVLRALAGDRHATLSATVVISFLGTTSAGSTRHSVDASTNILPRERGALRIHPPHPP